MEILTVDEAVKKVKDGNTVAIEAFGTIAIPEELCVALERRFLETGHPRDLTLFGPLAGDPTKRLKLGYDHFYHPGMVKRIIAATYALSTTIHEKVVNNEMEAYCFPLGALVHLFRDLGAGKPGTITEVGLGTNVDPRLKGGKLNDITKEDLVEIVTLNGKEHLWYKPIKVDVAFIRGTTTDERGNITMEKEATLGGAQAMAMAAKRYGGTTVVQVEQLAKVDALNPKMVVIPEVLTDVVVVSSNPEMYHRQTARFYYNPTVSGEIRIPISFDLSKPLDFKRAITLPVPLVYGRLRMDENRIIGRRAAMEISVGGVIGMGWGSSEYAGYVLQEEEAADLITFIVESGPLGGLLPIGNFNILMNPRAFLDSPNMLDLYNGPGMDATYIGFAQVDKEGNVNVSKVGGRVFGYGGFADIIHGAKKIVFCGPLTAGGLKIGVEDGELRILKEGKIKKFVNKLEETTFNSKIALDRGKEVVYVTERAVFKLQREGLKLIEVAPSIDVEKDILAKMEFKPMVAEEIKEMPSTIYKDEPLRLKEFLLNRGKEAKK